MVTGECGFGSKEMRNHVDRCLTRLPAIATRPPRTNAVSRFETVFGTIPDNLLISIADNGRPASRRGPRISSSLRLLSTSVPFATSR